MRFTSLRPGARPRTIVALVVLVAWFGTLLVVGPRAASAADPGIPAPSLTAAQNRGSTDPTFTVSGFSPDSAECAIVAGTAGAPAETSPSWVACGPTWTPDLGSDGTYTAYARTVRTTTTTTTNESDSSTAEITTTAYSAPSDGVAYQLDTTGPALSVQSGPPAGSTGNDAAVGWTVTADGGEPVTCSLTRDGAAYGVPGRCDAAAYPGEPLTGPGTYVLSGTAEDDLGNTRTASSLATYTLDLSGPVFTVASGPTGTGNDTTPSWTVTSDGGEVVTCELLSAAGGTAVPSGACTGYGPTQPLPQGSYDLVATATDSSGNTNTTTVATYVLDTDPPTVTVEPAAVSSAVPSAAWTVAVGGGGRTPTCVLTSSTQLTGETFGSGTDCAQFTSASNPFPLPREGTYTLTATTLDAAGNSATSSGTYLYRGAPTVTVQAPAETGNATTISWRVSAAATADLRCTLTGPGPDAQPVVVGCTYASSPQTDLLEGDGTYTFTAEAVDPDTQATGSAAATYLLDTQPLPVFTVGGSEGDQSSGSVAWTWTVTGATSSCQLQLGGAAYGAPAAGCTSPWTTALPADGSWTLAVTLLDAAGNPRTATSPEVRVDTAVPGSPAVSTPSTLSRDPAPVWTITGETGAVFTCSWTGPAGAAPLPTSETCASGYAPTLPDTDGVYRLSVTQTDAALNTSPATTVAYTLDRTAPVVTFVQQPTGPTSDPRVTWTTTVTELNGATVTTECRLVRRTTGADEVVYDWTACSGRTVTETLTAGDGTYVLSVRDGDAAGNVSAAGTSSRPFVLDTLGPGAPPSVTGPSGWGSVATVTWSIEPPTGETPDGYLCRLVRDGDTTGAWTGCDDRTFSTTLPAEGTYRLDVVAVDALDNRSDPVTSSVDYSFDPNPPGPAVFAGASSTGKATSHTWTWTEPEPSLSAECRLYQVDGSSRSLLRTTIGCTSPRSETLTAATAGTTYLLEVTLVDRALNRTAADGPTYLLDTVAPTAPAVTGPTGTDNELAARYAFVPSEAGTSAVCQLMQRPVGASGWTAVRTQSPCTTPWDVTLPAVDGDYTVRVVTTDQAGNPSEYGESAVYTLDVTGPGAAVFTSGPTGTDNLPGVSWTWTYEDEATATCAVDRVAPSGVTSRVVAPETCSGSYSTQLTAGDGTYTLTVTLTDRYGTLGASATSAPYTLDLTPPAPPTVTGPAETSNVTSVTWAVAGPTETGATAECRLERTTAVAGTTVVSDWTGCPLSNPTTLSGDGSYVFKVRLTDQHGNLGGVGASEAYLLDTTLPTAPVVTAPASPAKNANPVFTFVVDADTTAACSLARGTTVVGTADPCSGSFTGALAGLADGDYVLTVVSADAAGNTATASSAPYTYDTTAPAAPSVTGPTGPSQNRTPVFAWTAEPGAKPECSLQEKLGTSSAFVACASPYAPSLPADGTWVLTVRLTDSAGNLSDPGASGGYLLDTTAPATPVVTAPSSPGRDLAPSWSASTEDGSTTECRFSGPAATGTFAPCAFPLATPVSGDGSYVLEVRATDAAGNLSSVGSGTYVLDTTAPPAPVVAQPAGPGRSRTPTIAFTAEEGTTGSCRLTRGSTVLADSAACASPATLDLTGLPDGAYTLSVRAVDAAGNTGPAGTATYVLDTTAPAAPTYTLVAGSPSSDRAPTYAFTTEAGSTPACRLTTAGGATRDLACTSPLTLDLSGSIDGEYVLAVTARDAAGNTSPAASATYVLNSSAPAAPRVVGPATPGSTRTPTWRISSASPAECRLVRGTTVLRDWSPCGTSYTADLYAQPDGVYLLEARVVGTTAATASRYRLDTTGPAPATITAPPSPSTVRTPTWAVASPEANVTAECRVSVFGGVLQDWTVCGVSAAGSLFSFDLTGRGDGTYTLSARLTDSAGNLGAVATSDYVLDTSAPAAVGVVGPPSPGNDTTPTWTLNSTTGAKLACRVTSGQTVVRDFAPCADTFTADLTGLPDGVYTLTVHALSAAGTPGPETTSSYLLDTTASAAPGTLTGPTGPSRDRAPAWTFVLPAGSTAVCKVTYGGRVHSEGPCASPFTMDLSNAADGSYTLSVRAVDAAGNLGPAATAGYILRTVPAPVPVFTQLPGSPSSTTDPRWGFTTVRGVLADCRILVGGRVQDDWTACTSPYTMLLTGKPDGTYTLQVRSRDVAGNTSAPVGSDYVFDRSAAPLAVFLETPLTPGTDRSPTWVVAAPTGTPTAQCRLTTPRGVGQWTACSGPYTAATTVDGTYLLEARAVDPTGVSGPSSSAAYVLDTDAPDAPRYTETPPLVGNEDEISWSWADDPELLIECRFLRAGSPTAAWAACTSPYTASLGRLGQNTYTLEARAVDLAGNVSGVTSTSYRYDTTAPAAPVFASRPPARGTSSTVTWTFAVPVDTSAVCVVTRDGTVISEGACHGTFTIERMLGPATWTLSVRYVDSAGNVGPSTVGSYTLTTAVAVRDRVDAPPADGDPFGPPPTNGLGSPQGPGAAPAPPTSGPTFGPEAGQPRAGGALVRVPEPVKRAVRNVARALPIPPVVGIAEGTRVPDAIKNTLKSTITKPQLPLVLFFIVLLFLLVQNRIDRRDPKLAAAPVNAEPELEFGPRVITNLRTGGATA